MDMVYRLIKKVSLILAVCLALHTGESNSQGTKPDLTGGQILGRGECAVHVAELKVAYICFAVYKGGVYYIVAWDQRGETLIYRILIDPRGMSSIDDEFLELIWARNAT